MTGKRLLIALAWVAAAMVATLALLWVFQRSLIYLPSQAVPDPPTGVEEVSFTTDDGLTLRAWFIGSDQSRGAVVILNGNAGNRSHRLPLGEALAAAGYSVLLADYRGFGGNPGSPTEDGLALDARTALGYLRDRVGNDPVIYFGESLGAGVAIGLALEQPPDALILRSPFSSLPEIAAVHYWWLPSSLLLRDRYPNLERIGDIESPLLVIVGSEDGIVPPDQSLALYDEANAPKRLLTVDGASHNDVALLDGEEMVSGMVEFLDETLGG